MNPMNRVALFILFLVLVVGGFSACSSERPSQASAPEVVHNVPVFAIRPASMPDVLEVTGTVRAAQTSQLASQVMGNIVDVRVHEGDHVQRGQVLALIDDAQMRAAVDRAVAADSAAQQDIAVADSNLALADSTLKRYQALYEKKSVSPQEYDEVRARYQAALARRDMARAGQAHAKAALEQARTSLEYTRIRAPFDGVITEKKMDVGAFASPGIPLFTIEDLHRYRLEVAVNEDDLRYVHNGKDVSVVVDSLEDAQMKGRIVQTVPAADPTSRSFLVKVELPSDPRLRSGLFGRAQFIRGERMSVVIPRTAVVARGQLQGVYVVDHNEVASLRYVTVGKASGTQVEVLAGLQDGERLVTKPGDLELGGKRVEAN
jgi:RND family efflux transporter MFP subunit